MRRLLIAISILLCCGSAEAFTTEASFYTVASCLKESGQYRMSNGRLLDDSKATAASWDFPLGTRIKVKCGDREVVVSVTDRGPNRKLYRSGRKIDLSLAAAKALGMVEEGICKVEVIP